MLPIVCLLLLNIFSAGKAEIRNGFVKIATPKETANVIQEFSMSRDEKLSPECRESLQKYNKALYTLKPWALKMYDASAKQPSGLLKGHMGDFGAFDQCLDINEIVGNSTISGKYCFTFRVIQIMNFTSAMIQGVCAPSACNASEIRTYHLKLGMNLILIDRFLCQTKSDESVLTNGDIATLSVLGITFIVIILSTMYDFYIHYTEKESPHTILITFSIYTNTRNLCKRSKNESNITCINGIRSLSMIWIVFGHKVGFLRGMPVTNLLDIHDWIKRPFHMYVLGAPLAVDTFLLLSGTLTAYLFLNSTKRGEKFNIFKYYIHRYLRLTPALGIILVLHITLVRYLAKSPMWLGISYSLSKPCEDYWWSTLLYIQNYVNPSAICIGPSWYLSVDMQLFLLSPLVLIPLWVKPKFGLTFIILTIFTSIISPFVIVWKDKIHGYRLYNNSLDDQIKYNERYYYPTHTRAAPWLIGILTGYLIFKARASNFPEYIQRKRLQFIILGIWGIALSIILTCVFGGHDVIVKEYDRVSNTFYLALVPASWAIGIGWIIFACANGYGGFINWFLSLHTFQILGRLSYSIYLVHFLVLFYMLGAMKRNSIYFTSLYEFYSFWGDFSIALITGLLLCLSFELPFMTLEKVILSSIFRRK